MSWLTPHDEMGLSVADRPLQVNMEDFKQVSGYR